MIYSAILQRSYPPLTSAGSPDNIKDTVRRTINATEGRIMIGSTAELHNNVPLDNFLAMREALLDYSYK